MEIIKLLNIIWNFLYYYFINILFTIGYDLVEKIFWLDLLENDTCI